MKALRPPPMKGHRRPQYETVDTVARLKAWVASASEAGVVAVDTETDSLIPSRARLIGVSMSVEVGRACYIPLGHGTGGGDGDLALSGDAPTQIPMVDAVAVLKPMLEDPAVLKIFHNAKYDLQVFMTQGIRVTPVDDTMQISYALDGSQHGHGMDELADTFLGHETIKYSDVAGSGKNKISFDQVAIDKATDYAAEDADITLRLWRLFKPRLVPDRMVTIYEVFDRPLAPVIADMEFAGIKADPDVLRRMSQTFAAQLQELEQGIHALAGRTFNVASPKQLGEVLFDGMGLPSGRKLKSGGWSTDSSVLEPLAAQGHEIVAKVLEFRQLAKLKGTYTDALQKEINPRDGRVHTSYSLAATNTGRLSSSDPNLQNIPVRTEAGRNIRSAFVAEPGMKLISVDYSQIELRLVAEMAGIEALKQAFRDGLDIHAHTASQVFGVPMDEMTSEIRRKAKAINFGIIYGISGWGLAAQLGVPQSEATAFIKQYLERFHELKRFMDDTKATARQNGYVETLFGRKCWIPGIKDKNPARRGFAERQAINAPIQGSAADIMRLAMVRLPGALAAADLTGRMLLQVHDELLLEVPETEVDATTAVAKEVMEGAADLSIPLVVDAGVADNWRDAH